MTLYLYALFAYLAAGFASLLVPRSAKGYLVGGAGMVAAALVASASLPVMLSGETASLILPLPPPIGDAALVLDPLSAFFGMVVALLALPAIFYGTGYLAGEHATGTGLHWLFFVLLIVSMLAVPIAQSVLAFLFVWELMTISSFFLVIFHAEERATRSASLSYLITMHIGLLFLVAGFLALWNGSGSPDFAVFPAYIRDNPAMLPVVLFLLFVGFGLKAGFVPLHTWLPKAHPVAPSHVSGLMSGVMIKLGIYGILRMVFLFGPLSLGVAELMLAVSIVTAVVGVLFAIGQHDLKRLLAYHSVENIGIIGIGIGVGMVGEAAGLPAVALLGFTGALLHVLNHSLFKSLLFFGAGSVLRATGVLAIDRLGGLARRMPVTATLFLVGSIAISGIPPFNGFVSEFLVYLGMIRGFEAPLVATLVVLVFSVASLALVGALALLCFTKVFGIVFLGNARSEATSRGAEAGAVMLASMAFLALLCTAIGILPQPLVALVGKAAATLLAASAGAPSPGSGELAAMLAPVASISRLLLLFVAVALLALGARGLLLRRGRIRREETWGCGYPAPSARMQYTGESFARPLFVLMSPRAGATGEPEVVSGLFPVGREVATHLDDPVETRVIRPVADSLVRFFRRFSWIQNGNLQLYILYGLLFLIGIMAWTMGSAR